MSSISSFQFSVWKLKESHLYYASDDTSPNHRLVHLNSDQVSNSNWNLYYYLIFYWYLSSTSILNQDCGFLNVHREIKEFPVAQMVKNPPAGYQGLIPGLGSSSGIRNGNSIQYSCLESPMDKKAWGATVRGISKSQTRLSD